MYRLSRPLPFTFHTPASSLSDPSTIFPSHHCQPLPPHHTPSISNISTILCIRPPCSYISTVWIAVGKYGKQTGKKKRKVGRGERKPRSRGPSHVSWTELLFLGTRAGQVRPQPIYSKLLFRYQGRERSPH